MADICHVSRDELRNDEEETKNSTLHEERERDAEVQIGNLDDIEIITDAIGNAESEERNALLRAINTRDEKKISICLLRMIKSELITKLIIMESDQ